jgi:hypothetical protein
MHTDEPVRRGVRVAEGARLESVCTGNRTAGSNPALSANKKRPWFVDRGSWFETPLPADSCSAVIARKRSAHGARVAECGGKQGARVPRDGAPRTSSGPEGSSDKGTATGAAVSPGSLLHHRKAGDRGPGTGNRGSLEPEDSRRVFDRPRGMIGRQRQGVNHSTPALGTSSPVPGPRSPVPALLPPVPGPRSPVPLGGGRA